jgi:hypothetical protein
MLARLLRQLAPFQPTLIGTFPLGLQVDGSDLDIACTCDDLDAFERALRTALSDLDVVLATAAADTGVLRFYQRLGFRLLRIERDAFTPAAGYPTELLVDGIRLRDRAWLDVTW